MAPAEVTMPLPKFDKEQIEAENKRLRDEAAVEQARLKSLLTTELAQSRKAKSANFPSFMARLVPAAYRARREVSAFVSISHELYDLTAFHGELRPGHLERKERASRAAINLAERLKAMDLMELDHWIGDLEGFMQEWGGFLEKVDPKYSYGFSEAKKWRELIILFAAALEAREGRGEDTIDPIYRDYAQWLGEVVRPLSRIWEEEFGESPKCSANSPFYGVIVAIFQDADKPAPSHNTLKKALAYPE